MKYGIYDTIDNVWMGDKNGPKLFDTEDAKYGQHALELAKISAHMGCQQLGYPPTRLREREFTESVLIKRDEKEPIRSAVDALKRIERGIL